MFAMPTKAMPTCAPEGPAVASALPHWGQARSLLRLTMLAHWAPTQASLSGSGVLGGAE